MTVSRPGRGRFLSRGYQGAVFLQGDGSGRRVVKIPTGRWPALNLRRAMLRREHEAYGRVDGIPGVPRCYGLQDDGGLVLEYMDGEPYRENLPAVIDHRDRFFGELRERILALHAVGVAHADLKRRGNILVSPEGHPILLDFGSCVLRRADGGWLNGMLFRQACRMDLNAWVKLKYRRRYDQIAAEDQPDYQPTLIEGAARAVRTAWRKLSGRRFRKARRRRREQDSR